MSSQGVHVDLVFDEAPARDRRLTATAPPELEDINAAFALAGRTTPLEGPPNQLPKPAPNPSRRHPDPDERKVRTELHPTLAWAVEVERSIASILWHCPEHLGLVQRELDLNVHFTLPAHRLILEAIAIVGEKCAAADWSSVLEAICEIPGAFQECGQREGLDQIFTDQNQYPEGPRADLAEPILRDHIRFLKRAAVIRGTDPSKPVEHCRVGWGHLTKNKSATRPEHPAATGQIPCPYCGQLGELAGWREGEGETMKLKSTPARRNQDGRYKKY